MPKISKQEALDYHEFPEPGKISVHSKKPTQSQHDLSLAYSPGVAEPCLEIEKQPQTAYRYTSKGNLVAVISNGTAVLGLGNIGALASKPVMEGKGVLFKIFADIDVFDLEIDASDPDKLIEIVKALEPTFGGINLEDIKAPDCFKIEMELRKALKIPVMHDDQHGTAIISAAALLNALDLVEKKIEELVIIVSGAGAAAIACIDLYVELGAKKDNIILCDSKGVIHKGRRDLNPTKARYITAKPVSTLAEAIRGADMFLGLSIGNILTPEMVKTMNKRPIIFALANPNPEIDYNLAKQTCPDAIVATGRSDFPNQVNNVLGFPFIFRGALDVRATEINNAMKLAAVRAIAALAKEPVPEIVKRAYKAKNMGFNEDYIIPKPLDSRLLTTVSPAVAKAAIASGVAQHTIIDWAEYTYNLAKRMGRDDHLFRLLGEQANQNIQRIVFTEAEELKVLKAAEMIANNRFAKPILLGSKQKIKNLQAEYQLNLDGCEIIEPRDDADHPELKTLYRQKLLEIGKRRGYNYYRVIKELRTRTCFAMMMLENGDTDAIMAGYNRQYLDVLKQALRIIGTKNKGVKVAGMYALFTNRGLIFLADTTNIPDPSAQDLTNTAVMAAEYMDQVFNIKANIALLYHSNYGSSSLPRAKKYSGGS